MVDVRVDEAELNKSKEELIDQFSQLVDTKATIEKVTVDLAAFWAGPEHEKFTKMMTDSLGIVQGEFDKITKYLDYLTALCKVYDSYFALSQVSVLESGAIPLREDVANSSEEEVISEEQAGVVQEDYSGQKKQAPISM